VRARRNPVAPAVSGVWPILLTASKALSDSTCREEGLLLGSGTERGAGDAGLRRVSTVEQNADLQQRTLIPGPAL
jgi:hypothetical protein